jgi:hypothetical protein
MYNSIILNLNYNIMDIVNPDIHYETLKPIYNINNCTSSKHEFIPKLKRCGMFYNTSENCSTNQFIYKLKKKK